MKHPVVFLAISLLLSTSSCAPDRNGRLLTAAEEGDVPTVQALLSAGAAPNGLPDHEWTPLKAASFNGHVEVVRALVSAGAQVNRTDDDDTPLMLATWRGHVAVARILLEAGAAIETSGTFQPFQESVAHGHVSILGMLVAGVDLNQGNRRGYTKLMAASWWNRPNIVRILLAHGANVNAISSDGHTALSVAVRRNLLELMEMLLTAGADTELNAGLGRTALMWAAHGGRLEAAVMLLGAGADVTVRDTNGRTALDLATQADHLEVADLLAQAGAEPAVADAREIPAGRGASTDLVEAARDGDDAAVRFWLAQGADVNSGDPRGRTPMMWAAFNTHIITMDEAMSRRLLKFSDGSVDDYATFSTATVNPSC